MSDQLTQFGHVFSFELKYRLRQPAFYVFSALFFCLTFTATSTDSVQIGGGIGNVARNAPYIIARTVNAMGLFTVILITIFMSTVVSRDKDLGVREILYSTPLKKFPLLMGRFTATTLLAVFSASFAALGLLLASLMPYQTPEHIQAFSVLPYLYTMFILVLPNCLMAGALFFSVSILTGRAMATYVAMIALLRPVRLRLRVPGRPAEREPGRAAGSLRSGIPRPADPLLDDHRAEHPVAAADRPGFAEPDAVAGAGRAVVGDHVFPVPHGPGFDQGKSLHRRRGRIRGIRPDP